VSLIIVTPTKDGIFVSGDYRRESKYTDRDSNEVMYTTHSDFEQKVAAAYNMAVADATASLVATLEKSGVLKYDN
jgi:hypothetical protein